MYNAIPYLSALAVGAVIALIFAEIIRRLFRLKKCGYIYACIFMLGQTLLPPFLNDIIFPYRGVMPGWAVFYTLIFGAAISVIFITAHVLSYHLTNNIRLRFISSLLLGYFLTAFLILSFVK